MSAHTPGPWSTVSDEPYDLRVRAESRAICEVWLDDAPVHDYNDEQRANARLIAAAPDLLEALKGFVDGECHCAESITLPCVQCHAAATIAKAEGK